MRATILAGAVTALSLVHVSSASAQTTEPDASPTDQAEAIGLAARNERDLPVSANEMWQLISVPGHLEPIHPWVRENRGEELLQPRDGARDTIVYDSGLILERRFDRWRPRLGYDLTIIDPSSPAGTEVAHVSFEITSLAADMSRLSITASPIFPEEATPEQKRAAFENEAEPSLDRYFTAVLDGLDHYIRTGQPVTTNQFGGALPPYAE